MLNRKTPSGFNVAVPETEQEDSSPKFHPRETSAIHAYFQEHGYVVVNQVFDPALCDEVRGVWDREVKPSQSFLYRQGTARAERHCYNANGQVINPILGIQCLDPAKFGRFRTKVTEGVITSPELTELFNCVFSCKHKIVQTMYFESNTQTREHQDSYYLDSHVPGRMAGAWIALEDIDADAGRFFVLGGSHNIDIAMPTSNTERDLRNSLYINNIVSAISERHFEIHAPFLKKGDVVLWASRTIHGSLASVSETNSRSSITVHAVPDDDLVIKMQDAPVRLKLTTVNGVRVHCPKDLARMENRFLLFVETRFPNMFQAARHAKARWMIKPRRRAWLRTPAI